MAQSPVEASMSSVPASRPRVPRPQFSRESNALRLRTPIEELLLPEVIAELRRDLKWDWNTLECDEYRSRLAYIWSPPHSIHPEHKMPMLESLRQTKTLWIPYISASSELQFCNKATVFYWTDSANTQGPLSGPVILGSIWNAWTDAIGREPQTSLDEFFAVPVSVGERYAKTIPGILRAHKQLCAQVRGTLEDRGTGVGSVDRKYFKLQPLCEALITVFDQYKKVTAIPGNDGLRHYDDVAQEQSIVLVRTGCEDGLSAPISFDPLKQEALPLARSEDTRGIDVIRVPLQVGVRFVADLQLREEAAFPRSNVLHSDHPCMKCEREAFEWGDKRIALAQIEGKILPLASATTVKKILLCNNEVDESGRVFYDPHPFRLGWI